MNPWVYLIRSNAKVSVQILTKSQGHFFLEVKELLK